MAGRNRRVDEDVLDFDLSLISQMTRQTKRMFGEEETESPTVLAARRAWQTELTDKQRAYFVHYYCEQMCLREIGVLYGVDASTVSRTLLRARNRLRRILRYYYNDDADTE